MALLLKRSSDNLPSSIDDVIAQMVYGNQRKPPGVQNCPFQKLLKQSEDLELRGIWTASNAFCKALALKWLFPNVSTPFKMTEVEPVPPHLIVAYDAFKHIDVMELKEKYPGSVMKFGFFTSDIPGEAQLISKTVDKFETRTTPPTYDERIVIQLAKNSESLHEFLELGPSYKSIDTVQGEIEAPTFFPPAYDIPEEVIRKNKKKTRKRKGKFVATVETQEEELVRTDKETAIEITETENGGNEEQVQEDEEEGEEDEDEGDDGDDDDDEEDEEEEEEEGADETDKATSPMPEGENIE